MTYSSRSVVMQLIATLMRRNLRSRGGIEGSRRMASRRSVRSTGEREEVRESLTAEREEYGRMDRG